MEIFIVLFGIWVIQVITGYYVCRCLTRLPLSTMSKEDASFLFTVYLVPFIGLFLILFTLIVILLEKSDLFK